MWSPGNSALLGVMNRVIVDEKGHEQTARRAVLSSRELLSHIGKTWCLCASS